MDEKQPPPFFDSEEVKKLISAYGRFIPYQILKILGKDRITEISLGDLAPLERERQSLIQARFAPSRLRVWNGFFRTAAMPGMARFASGHGGWVPGEA